MLWLINTKRFWSNGSRYSGYNKFGIDKLLEALEIIIFNTYVWFNVNTCRQIWGMHMGGDAHYSGYWYITKSAI